MAHIELGEGISIQIIRSDGDGGAAWSYVPTVIEVADEAARLALAGLPLGAEVLQADNDFRYELIDADNADDAASWQVEPKIYKANLEVELAEKSAAPLVVGKTYRIKTYGDGDDFANVGAGLNFGGTVFVATGTTPTTWTNGSILEESGDLIPHIFKNEIGMDLTFPHSWLGGYTLTPSEADILTSENTFLTLSANFGRRIVSVVGGFFIDPPTNECFIYTFGRDGVNALIDHDMTFCDIVYLELELYPNS
jgi:hypothetical protein